MQNNANPQTTWTLQRRLPAGLSLLLAVVLALAGLAWQIDAGRGRMLNLLETELAAMRHTTPTAAHLAAVRAEFDGMRSALVWQLRAAAALGLVGTGLALALLMTAGPIRQVTSHRNGHFRAISYRR